MCAEYALYDVQFELADFKLILGATYNIIIYAHVPEPTYMYMYIQTHSMQAHTHTCTCTMYVHVHHYRYMYMYMLHTHNVCKHACTCMTLYACHTVLIGPST